jgi:putative transposase
MAKLKEIGLDVGERRVGRLMGINGIAPVCTPLPWLLGHKVTTDSKHKLGYAQNWPD